MDHTSKLGCKVRHNFLSHNIFYLFFLKKKTKIATILIAYTNFTNYSNFDYMVLNNDNRERYKRNMLLHDIGAEGQEKILNAKVLIIGVGGLGSPIALYLAAAGIGCIGLIDNDNVDISNLQRQIIHFTDDIGLPKVYSAKAKINAINPEVEVITYHELFDINNATSIISNYDIIIDATDNSYSKFFINDVCVANDKPLIHGAINQYTGNVMTILPGTANYRTLFPEQPTDTPSSASFGILGVVAGIIGIIQATEALKYITGIGALLTDTLLTYDALTMDFTKIHISK